MKNKVKWFDNRIEYELIAFEKDDIFVQYQAIYSSGCRILKEGQYVEFEIVDATKGLQTKHIRPTISLQTIK